MTQQEISPKMFCFQCQEANKGIGCILKGVCGKESSTAAAMDLLLHIVKGISIMVDLLHTNKADIPSQADRFVTDALFCTITNANFDNESIFSRIDKGLALRDELKQQASDAGLSIPEADETSWNGTRDEYFEKAQSVGVLRETNEDIRSLKELILYGLKGMAAYHEHAIRLGYTSEALHHFMHHALSQLAIGNLGADALVALALETGAKGVEVMALLDKANTERFGHPEITKVNIGVGQRPGILISGHDLHDIEELLIQTEGTGIDVYTHSEMLPAHYYPQLKKYEHLKGNYGNAWWKQREEFAAFNGPIVFTTNCIVPPTSRDEYKDRIFTSNSTGYPGCRHIEEDANGHKDYSEVIALAKTCKAPTALEEGTIIGGFAHNQVIQLADKVVEAVKSGAIRKFIVMAGCDGRMKSREYYSEFAKALPNDCVILTAGCAKYKYNKLELGDIGGIPRLLDAGQCNDSYSLAVIALTLKEVFQLDDINELPISYNISWYEQKAVIVLLALLHLGVKNIHLGPTLPAFLSANVAKVLVDTFGIAGIGTVDEDLKKMA